MISLDPKDDVVRFLKVNHTSLQLDLKDKDRNRINLQLHSLYKGIQVQRWQFFLC